MAGADGTQSLQLDRVVLGAFRVVVRAQRMPPARLADLLVGATEKGDWARRIRTLRVAGELMELSASFRAAIDALSMRLANTARGSGGARTPTSSGRRAVPAGSVRADRGVFAEVLQGLAAKWRTAWPGLALRGIAVVPAGAQETRERPGPEQRGTSAAEGRGSAACAPSASVVARAAGAARAGQACTAWLRLDRVLVSLSRPSATSSGEAASTGGSASGAAAPGVGDGAEGGEADDAWAGGQAEEAHATAYSGRGADTEWLAGCVLAVDTACRWLEGGTGGGLEAGQACDGMSGDDWESADEDEGEGDDGCGDDVRSAGAGAGVVCQSWAAEGGDATEEARRAAARSRDAEAAERAAAADFLDLMRGAESGSRPSDDESGQVMGAGRSDSPPGASGRGHATPRAPPPPEMPEDAAVRQAAEGADVVLLELVGARKELVRRALPAVLELLAEIDALDVGALDPVAQAAQAGGAAVADLLVAVRGSALHRCGRTQGPAEDDVAAVRWAAGRLGGGVTLSELRWRRDRARAALSVWAERCDAAIGMAGRAIAAGYRRQ